MRRALTILALFLATLDVTAQGTTIRVVTYNIHHGAGTDGRVDLNRVAGVLGGADVIGLQEVDVHNARSGFADEAKAIGDRLGMRYRVFGQTRSWFWFMRYGNAIVSRYPIVGSRNHALPRNPADSEPRKMLQADIRVGAEVIHVFVTHLSLRQSERALQTAEIMRIIGGTSGRCILMGDFNALPPAAEIATVTRTMRDAWALRGVGAGFSFSSWNPQRRIDYILVPASGVTLDSVRVRPTRQRDGSHPSDHLPVEAVLRIP